MPLEATAMQEGASRFATAAKSPLVSATPAQWKRFLLIMGTKPIRSKSESGGMGSFDIRPRRLGELGVMKDLHRGEGGKWTGTFAAPYSEASFNVSQAQVEIFEKSMAKYEIEIREGRLAKPTGVSMSGALAILHCGGEGALSSWPAKAFKNTRETFNRANGIF